MVYFFVYSSVKLLVQLAVNLNWKSLLGLSTAKKYVLFKAESSDNFDPINIPIHLIPSAHFQKLAYCIGSYSIPL